jgi:hypothetical protein
MHQPAIARLLRATAASLVLGLAALAAHADAPAPFPVAAGDFEGGWRGTSVGAFPEGWEAFNLLEGMGFGRRPGVRGSAVMIAGDFCGLWRQVSVEPNRRYRLTVWMAAAGEQLTHAQFGWELHGQGWFCQRCQRFGLPRTIHWVELKPPDAGPWPGRTWHRFSTELTTTGPKITVWLNPGGDGELYVDEVSLVDLGPADPATVAAAARSGPGPLRNGGFQGPWQETPVGMIAESWGVFNTTNGMGFAREPGVSGWGQAVGINGRCGIYQVAKVSPGRRYRLTYSVKAVDGYLTTARCGWDTEGGGWVCPYCGNFGFPSTLHWEELWSPRHKSWPPDEWQTFSFDITATGPALSIWFNPEGGDHQVLDNVSLVMLDK